MSMVTGRRLDYFYKKVREVFEKEVDPETILRKTGDASKVTAAFTKHKSRTLPASGEALEITLGKILKYLGDLKTVAFTGSYDDLANRLHDSSDNDLDEHGKGFSVRNGDSIELSFEYPGGSLIGGVQYLLVIRVTNINTGAFYGATARIITVPSLDFTDDEDGVARGNVNVLSLGTSSSTGYTLTAGVEKLTVKAAANYKVEGTYYRLRSGN